MNDNLKRCQEDFILSRRLEDNVVVYECEKGKCIRISSDNPNKNDLFGLDLKVMKSIFPICQECK